MTIDVGGRFSGPVGGDPKERVKEGILNKFRETKVGENGILPPNWLCGPYYSSLDYEENRVFSDAIKELVKSGIVEIIDHDSATGNFNLRPTKKGVEVIYNS